ncbi:MAG: hypothetical protein ACTSYX_04490 [Candidatus Thorarchaeota archaeon]
MQSDSDSEVIVFFGLTLAIGAVGYLPWVLSSYGYLPPEVFILLYLGGISPMLAAVIIANKNYGSRSGFLFGSFKKDLCGRWLVLAIVLPLLIFVASVAPLAFLGQPLDFAGLDWVQFLPLFPVMVFMNVWEEIGWRGYALPKLQERHDALVSGTIVGVF